MLSKSMEEALNAQINAELYSAYIYLSMSTYFEANDFPGMASWMRHQAQEEVDHAMKFYRYVVDRDGRVTLAAIDAPPTDWKSPLAAFEKAYKHEQHVTGLINELVAQADEENDYATRNMLDWFVDEQVEEEATASAIVARLKLIGDNAPGLIMLDRELGARGTE
ncbi:MAG: ferritin [Gemmatimonadetes bacterium]|uniref:Ferritin n=1 Tax=Candidatus Kutchimonas denitrificans TaxID=3056748 RepID=A0AAE5C9W1_9BACT|nr:ferritin [Gemmatimonadota bacterium]NIR75901.1 ferritin [Candidatus Kutchimonas denitrificans]NIS02062.1 ferritin [Gemmatimonadota bacterium]NIT67868.1 ferritin [Gemmatimonadota bacterium]NIU53847.1 ferritin [Gemmatimonadota bacterium]